MYKIGGSVKSWSTMPWIYPANIGLYSNGTSMNPRQCNVNDIEVSMIFGIQGYINTSIYNEWVQNGGCYPYLGVPQTFNGYNNVSRTFPYWASQPITFAANLLAITKYHRIV